MLCHWAACPFISPLFNSPELYIVSGILRLGYVLLIVIVKHYNIKIGEVTYWYCFAGNKLLHAHRDEAVVAACVQIVDDRMIHVDVLHYILMVPPTDIESQMLLLFGILNAPEQNTVVTKILVQTSTHFFRLQPHTKSAGHEVVVLQIAHNPLETKLRFQHFVVGALHTLQKLLGFDIVRFVVAVQDSAKIFIETFFLGNRLAESYCPVCLVKILQRIVLAMINTAESFEKSSSIVSS